MTTTEVANRLYELCKAGDYNTCYQELYAQDCKSIENDGTVCNGLEEMAAKGKQWNEGIEEFHGSSIGQPIVSGAYFSLAMGMDVKFKGSPVVTNFEEICVYHVKDGKVVQEQFFYEDPA